MRILFQQLHGLLCHPYEGGFVGDLLLGLKRLSGIEVLLNRHWEEVFGEFLQGLLLGLRLGHRLFPFCWMLLLCWVRKIH